MRAGEINVVQAAAWFAPYNIGGTEVYLEGLIRELERLDANSTVVVPRNPNAPAAYLHGGIPVMTYSVNEPPAYGEMRGGRPHLEFEAFASLLRENVGAIYHQHSWTRGCGPHHLAAARELGFPTVLTIHVPGNICLRGTMMRFGASACDGYIDEQVCGACWAQGRGVSKAAAQTLAALPLAVAKLARQRNSRLATALAARAIGAERQRQFREMIENADRVVAVCQWLYDALEVNGVSTDKLVLSRQGISADLFSAAPVLELQSRNGGPLKLLYLGRCDPVKGISVLVRAVRMVPADMAVTLTICAIATASAELEHERQLRRMAAGDSRISFAAPVPRNEISAFMEHYDAVAVPSIWMETGPLVVLEAQAMGLFVLGSRLGGITELVSQDGDGELIEAGNVKDWAHAIERLIVRRARGGLSRPSHQKRRQVRTMSTVAIEMARLYRSLC